MCESFGLRLGREMTLSNARSGPGLAPLSGSLLWTSWGSVSVSSGHIHAWLGARWMERSKRDTASRCVFSPSCSWITRLCTTMLIPSCSTCYARKTPLGAIPLPQSRFDVFFLFSRFPPCVFLFLFSRFPPAALPCPFLRLGGILHNLRRTDVWKRLSTFWVQYQKRLVIFNLV